MAKRNFKVIEARALVNAANSDTELGFNLINTLVSYLNNGPKSKEISVLLSTLPQPLLVCQRVEHMDEVEFLLWKWNVLSKDAPSRSLIKEMNDFQETPLFESATFSQREKFGKILKTIRL